MSLKEVLEKVDKLVDLLNELKEDVERIKKQVPVLPNPTRSYAICEVGHNVGSEIEIFFSFGDFTFGSKFSRYSGKYVIYSGTDFRPKELKLDDGTTLDFYWIDEIARIFSAMTGKSKKTVIEDMLACIYTSGTNKPVGFLFDRYFAIVAPLIEADTVVED